jgi:hypothetical protein
MTEREINATHVITKHPEEAWTALPDSRPQRRVRLAADSPLDEVTVVVYKDGSFDTAGEVEIAATYPDEDEA